MLTNKTKKIMKVKVTQSCLTLCDPTDHTVPGILQARILSILQAIIPTQGSNPGHHHCSWILYQLSHKGSPRILEWVAYPFSRSSSQPRKTRGFLHCRRILYQLSYQGSPQKIIKLRQSCDLTCILLTALLRKDISVVIWNSVPSYLHEEMIPTVNTP